MPPLPRTESNTDSSIRYPDETSHSINKSLAVPPSRQSDLTQSGPSRPASPRRRAHSTDIDLHTSADPLSSPSARASFKKPRTLSPSTEGNSDSDSPQPPLLTSIAETSSTFLHPDSMDALPPSNPNGHVPADGGDKAVDHLLTERSLILNDGHDSQSVKDEALPSYTPNITRPSGQEQLALVKQLKDKPLSLGATWFLLSRSWFRAWSSACVSESGGSQFKTDNDSDGLAELGPIDCSSLSADPESVVVGCRPALKLNLSEGIDFELIPEELWTSLAAWYGLNGPLFPRRVITKPHSTELTIELHPPRFDVYELTAASDANLTPPLRVTSLVMSVTASIAELKQQVSQAFSWTDERDKDNMRFWRLRAGIPEALQGPHSSEQHTLALQSISENAELLEAGEEKPSSLMHASSLGVLQLDQPYEVLGVDRRPSRSASWLVSSPVQSQAQPAGMSAPRPLFAQDSSNDSFSALQSKKSIVGSVSGRSAAAGEGLGPASMFSSQSDRVLRSSSSQHTGTHSKGLQNLGNTCFMNSALQCLSNTPELQEYFVSNAYVSELNADNPLGQGGALAKAFGLLLQKLWASGGPGSVVPREFKTALARFAPQFTGYAQQDTQELLAFLLDGLHEDLNRIHKKPYVETPDWEGGGVKEMVLFAKKQWELYKLRNDSVIVDLFQGQYRSTLVCPVCDKVSIKFDPFMYLTLPIPNHKKWKGEVVFVPANLSKPSYKTVVELPQGATISTLRTKMATLFGTDAKKLVLAELFQQRVYRWYFDYEAITEIALTDIVYCWELPSEYIAPRRENTSRFLNSSTNFARHPVDAEKGPPPPEEETAILPVFCEAPSDAYRSDTKVGVPFLIAVPRSEMDDVEAVQNILISHLSRYSSSPEAFMEAAAEHGYAQAANAKRSGSAVSIASDNVGPEWEMVDGTTSSSEVIAPPILNTNQVAELHDGGESIRMVAEPLQEASHGSDLGNPIQHSRNVPNVHKKPMFEIRFSSRHLSEPMPKSAGVADSEDLVERLDRLSAARSKHHATHTVQSKGDADSEMVDGFKPSGVTGKAESIIAASEGKSWPTFYTGGALVCYFQSSARKQFFEVDPSRKAEWGSVELFKNPETDRAGPQQKSKLSLEDCLDEFTREEQLGEEDPWYCPQCKEFRQATKKFDLWKVPDLLVVHLKRFSSGRYSRDKLDVPVEYPSQGLDLSGRVEGPKAVKQLEEAGEDLSRSVVLSMSDGQIQPSMDANDDAVAADQPIYDLYAVDNHYGGLGGGHYTAHAKNPADSQWYYFDDSSVRPTSDEDAKSRAAYVLFYRRRTSRSIGGKTRDVILQQQNAAVSLAGAKQPAIHALAADVNGSAAESEQDLSFNMPGTSQYPSALPGSNLAGYGPFGSFGHDDELADDDSPYRSAYTSLRSVHDEGYSDHHGGILDSDSTHANHSEIGDGDDVDVGRSFDAETLDLGVPDHTAPYYPGSQCDDNEALAAESWISTVD